MVWGMPRAGNAAEDVKRAIVLVPDDWHAAQNLTPFLLREMQARCMLSMGINKFRRLVSQGVIPFVWDGGKRKYLTSDLRAYADSLPKGDPESLPNLKTGPKMLCTTKPKPQEVQPCP